MFYINIAHCCCGCTMTMKVFLYTSPAWAAELLIFMEGRHVRAWCSGGKHSTRLLTPFFVTAARRGGASGDKETLFSHIMHIGEEIRLTMKAQNRTTVWLARQLSCSRTNVYKIYASQSLDTNTLRRIAMILNVDFFAMLSTELSQKNEE